MNLNLSEYTQELAVHQELVSRALADGEVVVGPPSLVPATVELEGVYEVWSPLSTGQWIAVSADGAVVYADALPAAEDYP